MKEIRIVLEDEEYARLLRAKGSRTWKQFIMLLADERPMFVHRELDERYANLRELPKEKAREAIKSHFGR